jgi:hypothetical protein
MKKPIAVAKERRTREAFSLKQSVCHSGRCNAVLSFVGGFTLVELLVSTLVVTLIAVVAAQLMNHASALTRAGQKYVSTDTQARVVLDRMGLDFAQMLKRTDIDYFLKGPANYNQHGHGQGHGWGHHQAGQQGSDQIAFFTHVPGYYPAGAQSPISLVAYRVNQSTNTNRAWLKLERLGRGLLWNGTNSPATPLVFLPLTIDSLWPWAVNNNSTCGGNSSNNSCDPDGYYEVIGPGVFRFEYYYVLKNGRATDVPWNVEAGHTSMAQIGLGDVEAIGVIIAVINSADRAILDAASAANPNYTPLLDLALDLSDFTSAHGRGVGNQTRYIGMVEADWENTLEQVAAGSQTSSGYFPPAVASAIRVYGRIFDLKTLPTF